MVVTGTTIMVSVYCASQYGMVVEYGLRLSRFLVMMVVPPLPLWSPFVAIYYSDGCAATIRLAFDSTLIKLCNR